MTIQPCHLALVRAHLPDQRQKLQKKLQQSADMRLAAAPPVCAAGLVSCRRHGSSMVAAASRRDAMLVTGTAAIAAALAAPPVLPVLAEGVAALEPMEALKGKDYGKQRMR